MGAPVPSTSSIHTHPSAIFPLALGRGRRQEQVVPMAEQSALPAFPLAYPYPSPTERTVSPWARNHSYTRDGRYTVRMRKPGQDSGAIKTAANLLPCPPWEVIPHRNSLWAQLNMLRFLLTEAHGPFLGFTVRRLCCGLVADSTSSWPFLLRGRWSATWLAVPGPHSHRARLRAR